MSQTHIDPIDPTAAPSPVVASDPPNGTAGQFLRDLTSGSAGTLILLVLVFACYAWSTQGTYVWDDDAYVVNNTTLRSFAGLSRIWTEPGATPQYYPMTFTSFWLEVQAFGLKPQVSHVVNALLHAGSTLLLWKILRRLSVPGAWVAAAVFAVHPIQVESVAWISERKNTLSMLLAMASTWMYLRYARLGADTNTAPAGEGINVALPDDPKRLYRLFLALFVLALLAKTAVAVLPLMLLAIVWWQRGRLTKADLLPMLPAFVLAAVAGAVTSHIEHSTSFVGASGLEWDVSPVQRLMLVGQTAAFYAYKILWPFGVQAGSTTGTTIPVFPISFNYERWTVNAASVVQWLPLVVLIGVGVTLAAGVKRFGRGPLTAFGLFVIGLLPVSGLVTFFPQRFSWVADHLAYYGSVGLIVGVVALLAIALRRKPVVAAGLTTVLLAAMVGVTFWNALSYVNAQRLWERTLRQNPNSWLAMVNYAGVAMDKANADADALAKGGDIDEAVKQRDENRRKAEIWLNYALKRNPNAYEAYRSLGILAAQRGKPDDALAHFRKSQETAAAMGVVGYRWPTFSIAELLIAQGKTDEGLAELAKLEALEPQLSRGSPNLFAQIRTRHGDVLRNRITGRIGPGMSQADRDLLEGVIDQYTRATEVGPEYVPPKVKLARILLDLNQRPEALQQIGDVLKLDKTNPDAQFMTAQIAVSETLYDAAATQLMNLMSNYPGYLPAHLEMAKVLQTMGRPKEAADELHRTLVLFPGQPDAERMLAELEGRPATTMPATTAPATAPLPSFLQ